MRLGIAEDQRFRGRHGIVTNADTSSQTNRDIEEAHSGPQSVSKLGGLTK